MHGSKPRSILRQVLGGLFWGGVLAGGAMLAQAIFYHGLPEAHLEYERRSNTKVQLRQLALAIESYRIDHGSYPAFSTRSATVANDPGGKTERNRIEVPTFTLSGLSGAFLAQLTTPVAYLENYPLDTFSEGSNELFAYRSFTGVPETDASSEGWIAWSRGPDRDYDLTLENISRAYNPAEDEQIPNPFLLGLTYDPTNGAKSNGDIYRTR